MLLFYIFQNNANAQQKLEKESRIKPDNVPSAALKFIEAVEMGTRWKWYFEENLKGNSVEAKTKYNGKRYSVEFDISGAIQDVEIEISWQEMDENLQKNIVKSLDSLFTKHSIFKIQIHYSSESHDLLEVLNNKTTRSNLKVKYEIVAKGKKTGRPGLYELTFNDEGNLLESSKIIFRNTDNLEY